jgi:hypothetical protein
MGLKTETSRNRDEAAADLAELAAVDWAQVWQGYSDADPRTWCAERGWQLAQLDRVENMSVRLRSGGLLYLRQARQWTNPTPVASAAMSYWSAGAESPADNGTLFSAAETVWPEYLAGASATVGTPAIVTSFDDPAFPDLPDWPPQTRTSRRRPYRLALWYFNGALALFYVSPSADAIATDQPGGIQIKLLLRPADAAGPTGGS